MDWNLHHVHVQYSVRDLDAQHFIPRSKTETPREAGIITENFKSACVQVLMFPIILLCDSAFFLSFFIF